MAYPIVLIELVVRSLCDVGCALPAEGAFLFGQTRDNQASVLSAARYMIDNKLVDKILFIRSDPMSGYPGFSVWHRALCRMGVASADITGVALKKTTSLNTLIEADALIRHCRQRKLQTIYVVASPFHQIRAFMTTITVALKQYPDMRIYSYNGHPLSWLDPVVHSQGTTSGFRKDLIKAEFDRIRKYQCKGDLASESAILNYLNARDLKKTGPDAVLLPVV